MIIFSVTITENITDNKLKNDKNDKGINKKADYRQLMAKKYE